MPKSKYWRPSTIIPWKLGNACISDIKCRVLFVTRLWCVILLFPKLIACVWSERHIVSKVPIIYHMSSSSLVGVCVCACVSIRINPDIGTNIIFVCLINPSFCSHLKLLPWNPFATRLHVQQSVAPILLGYNMSHHAHRCHPNRFIVASLFNFLSSLHAIPDSSRRRESPRKIILGIYTSHNTTGIPLCYCTPGTSATSRVTGAHDVHCTFTVPTCVFPHHRHSYRWFLIPGNVFKRVFIWPETSVDYVPKWYTYWITVAYIR